MAYDVIIAGASFAGLAVASQLRGNVLVIDRSPIGADPISANATTQSVIDAVGAEDSVLQVHAEGMIYTHSAVTAFKFPDPYVTFDYDRFCRALSARGTFQFEQALITRVEEGKIISDRGTFEGGVVVDATGWHALSASAADGGPSNNRGFGIGAEAPARGDGLGFWLDPAFIKRGYGWYFPAGDHARIGVGAFDGRVKLKKELERLADWTSTPARADHGGWLNSGLRAPLVGTTFLVGDASGQCLPLTGEGIRPAVYFGVRCGRLIQAALDGRMELPEARRRYASLVARHRCEYNALALVQRVLPRMPQWVIRTAVRAGNATFLRRYSRAFPVEDTRAMTESRLAPGL